MCCLPQKVFAEEVLMAIRVNGEIFSEGEIVQLDGDEVSLPPALVRRLRLRLPPGLAATVAPLSAGTPPQTTPAVPAAEADTVSLAAFPGVQTHIDRNGLVLDLTVDPSKFEPAVFENFAPQREADAPQHPGLFLNYDLLAQDTQNSYLESGLFSLGAFSDYGVLINDAVVSNQENSAIRLRNYLIQDNGPQKGTMIVGDTFLPVDSIGEQFPFGGIQFSSRSSGGDLRQIPSETILGQAAVPSTVDVYVNNALQSRQSVPTGPFILQNIPVATGDGDIRVVVRDALGQEQVLTRSFYTSPYLLPAGDGDYTYQAGMLRQNYGETSFDYTEPFASGTQRYGWSDWLTTEFHGEASTLRQMIGGQGSFLIAPFGTLRAGGAVSDRDGPPGIMGLIGGETGTHPFSIGISSQISSSHFTQLGYPDYRTTQQSSQIRTSYDFDKGGSLSASLLRVVLAGQPVSDTVAASYSLNIPRVGFVGLSAFDTFGRNTTGVILSFSTAFGETGTATTQVTHDQNGWGVDAQATQNAPITGGFGYRALFDQNAISQRGEAGMTYLTDSYEIAADAGALDGAPLARLGATGSVGLFDGETFASRQTNGNFAVVETGFPGIHVSADRQPIGVTDGDGKLVIPHLRANEVNTISIDPADIPFNVAVTQPDQEIVPRNQTGYVVNFGLRQTRSATAVLFIDDHTPVPPGSIALNTVTGEKEIVGNEGMIYFTGLTGDDHFEIALQTGICQISVRAPETEIIQPDLGIIKCQS